MARLKTPKVVRARVEYLREGGQIITRLLVGESMVGRNERKPWYGVQIWNRPVIRYPSLADAEEAFEQMTAGQVELQVTKPRR